MQLSKLVPVVLSNVALCLASQGFESDTFPTASGPLAITFVGHGTLMLTTAAQVIHVDPVSEYADYGTMPDADIVVITHEHGDHLDPKAVAAVRKESTRVVCPAAGESKLEGVTVMRNGDSTTIAGIGIKAVPAYNLVHMRDPKKKLPYHPKGSGNGYILTIGGTRVYIAGDTENIPEMKTFGPLDIAFIPVNLPYTMDVDMAADAAKMLKAKVLYPYHFGTTDTAALKTALEKVQGTEVRIRKLQ